MGKYAASTFMSHIQISFNYSGLLGLQHKLKDRLDNFFNFFDQWHFKLSDWELSTLNTTFKFYKGNTDEIFKLFNDLLVSLPPVWVLQHRQWDVADSSALTLAK